MHGIFAHSTSWVQFLCKYSAALGDTGGVHISAEFSSLAIGMLYTKKGGGGQQEIFFHKKGEFRPSKLQQFCISSNNNERAPQYKITDEMQIVGCRGASRAPAMSPAEPAAVRPPRGPRLHTWQLPPLLAKLPACCEDLHIYFCCKFMMHYFCERLSFCFLFEDKLIFRHLEINAAKLVLKVLLLPKKAWLGYKFCSKSPFHCKHGASFWESNACGGF